jgi:hypothetical protein
MKLASNGTWFQSKALFYENIFSPENKKMKTNGKYLTWKGKKLTQKVYLKVYFSV